MNKPSNTPPTPAPHDLLAEMTRASEQRYELARDQRPFEDVWNAALKAPPPREIDLRPGGFGLIAECKLASPSEGTLRALAPGGETGHVVAQALEYARAGAAAVSVLTEPTHFGGSLEHLASVAREVNVPVMRKDFLVADYQVVEARAAGASGVLLIVRMLADEDLYEMLDLTLDLRMFALVEAFDQEDLERLGRVLITRGRELSEGTLLVGLNCRNLSDLSMDQARFAKLRAHFPRGLTAVAESGLSTPADVAGVAALGYDGALVGSSLMRSEDPFALAQSMLSAGREARAGASDRRRA